MRHLLGGGVQLGLQSLAFFLGCSPLGSGFLQLPCQPGLHVNSCFVSAMAPSVTAVLCHRQTGWEQIALALAQAVTMPDKPLTKLTKA